MKKLLLFLSFFFFSLHVFAQDSTKIRDNKYVDVPATCEEFTEWYRENVKYPAYAREHNIQGKVIAQVTIDENGEVINYFIKSNTHELLNEEVIRLIEEIPEFEPAQHQGKKVKVYFEFTATFKLEG